MKLTILILIASLTASFFIFKHKTNRDDLFIKTDNFVETLQTKNSYSILRILDNTTLTNDSIYRITPLGRLIDVKFEKAVSDEDYISLKNDLTEHYKNDKRVNQVYINQNGTIIIDCRN